jgi:hypothetical protein
MKTSHYQAELVDSCQCSGLSEWYSVVLKLSGKGMKRT